MRRILTQCCTSRNRNNVGWESRFWPPSQETHMSVEVETQGGVTLVTWRRPDVHNAVDASTARTSALAAEGLL